MKDFYKVKNGILVKFKARYIKHNNKVYSNPTEEQLRLAGWKTAVFSDKPEDGMDYYYTAVYDDSGDEIVQTWEKQEIVYDEFLEELTG